MTVPDLREDILRAIAKLTGTVPVDATYDELRYTFLADPDISDTPLMAGPVMRAVMDVLERHRRLWTTGPEGRTDHIVFAPEPFDPAELPRPGR
jgi:hypothetical protein